MKIVLFDHFFEPGFPGVSGLSDLVWNWARELVAMGDEVHIVAPYPPNIEPPLGAIVHRFPVPPMGYRNIVGQMLTVLRGWVEVRRIRDVQVIHLPEYVAAGILAVLCHPTPVVLTTPGSIFERIENVNHADWFTTQVYKIMARVSARRCARIIATSAEMARWWEFSGAQAEKVVQIPLGVDTRTFRRIPGARATLGWQDSPCVLFVGRFQSENGAKFAIRAMASVAERIPTAMLHMVGWGPEQHELEQLTESLGLTHRVAWHGRVPLAELPLYYSASDVFVLPRLSRVTPRALFEAMACGLPVVVSEVGGMGEFIQPGSTGFVVDPRDCQHIAGLVIELLRNSDTALNLGRNARAFACTNLDWSFIVDRMRTVYEHVGLPPVVRAPYREGNGHQ